MNSLCLFLPDFICQVSARSIIYLRRFCKCFAGSPVAVNVAALLRVAESVVYVGNIPSELPTPHPPVIPVSKH